MDPVLIPPGRSQTWKCPAGSKPAVAKGQVLKMQDKPALYVIDAGADGIVLGPLVAGDIEIAGLCENQPAVVFRVEAPDPQKVSKKIIPLSPVDLAYPWWLWIAMLLAVVFLVALVGIVKRFVLPRKGAPASPLGTSLRKSPTQKMEIFLSRVAHEGLVEKSDAASSQLVYAEGIKRLRALLQEAYGFRAAGATTTEFIAETKAQALRKPSLLPGPQLAQLEAVFMQAKQVTYAQEIPDPALRRSYLKSLTDFAGILNSKISANQSVAREASQRRGVKGLLKKKGKP